MTTKNEDTWFPFEGFLRMRTDYKVTLDLDALILSTDTTHLEIKQFIEHTIKGVKENERKT